MNWFLGFPPCRKGSVVGMSIHIKGKLPTGRCEAQFFPNGYVAFYAFDDGCKVMDMIDNAHTIIEAEGSGTDV